MNLPNVDKEFVSKLSGILLAVLFSSTFIFSQADGFSLESVKSYPFPNELTSAANAHVIAWATNKEGLRNVYTARGPDYIPVKITDYDGDSGQEISSLSLSADGKWVVFIKGGDFGSNWDDEKPVNPNFDPQPPKVQIWSVPSAGGEAVALGEGTDPRISSSGDSVVFVNNGQLWLVPVNGSAKAEKLFAARGSNASPEWAPDSRKIAFRSNRGDHSFIGIFDLDKRSIAWLAPSFYRDANPRWSPDGKKITFTRQPGAGGQPDKILTPRHEPWNIMIADVLSGEAIVRWTAPLTLEGSMSTTHGRSNLHWAGNHIVFMSYQDGWPHLYAIHETKGREVLLTPGNYMAEYISVSPDGKWVSFAGNTGPDALDIDRRHIIRVSVTGGNAEVLTPGPGLEWTPFITGDGKHMAFISATAQRPPLPAVMDLESRKVRLLGETLIPEDFPESKLVTPRQIIFDSPDGTKVHATLFQTNTGPARKPAIIYVHGGPPRQMLLGWHYSSYYSNAYALNQYLASQGFIVLSVNYRLGIGYGFKFHNPPDGGWRGASEYQDIKAAGEWLASQSYVDAERIGIYGGSYGGYLTAMALGRDSDLFAAGVDIHGVHDRTDGRINRMLRPDQYEIAPDAEYAVRTAWESSPVADVDGWKSPVLIIHGDDDRNVQFSQSTDLVQRLINKGIDLETMVIVDDTHHFMLHANQMKVNRAAAEFLIRKLK